MRVGCNWLIITIREIELFLEVVIKRPNVDEGLFDVNAHYPWSYFYLFLWSLLFISHAIQINSQRHQGFIPMFMWVEQDIISLGSWLCGRQRGERVISSRCTHLCLMKTKQLPSFNCLYILEFIFHFILWCRIRKQILACLNCTSSWAFHIRLFLQNLNSSKITCGRVFLLLNTILTTDSSFSMFNGMENTLRLQPPSWTWMKWRTSLIDTIYKKW